MKYTKLCGLGLLAMLGLAGCAGTSKTAPQGAEETSYHKISSEKAKEMMDEGDVVILDVRTPEEYAAGHIAEAVNLPNEAISTEQPEELPDPEAVILVYCRSGARSKVASEKLVQAGYQNIYDFGGIIDWPYDVVK